MMATKDLTKHMMYYQRIVQSDPTNIEANLRLAAIYRESGSINKAVDAYVNSSRLLASQGLLLEAIAACKAILELDATHTDTQFFLARLYAQAPGSAGAIVQQLPGPPGGLAGASKDATTLSSSPVVLAGRGSGMVHGRVIQLQQGGMRRVSSRSEVTLPAQVGIRRTPSLRDEEVTVAGHAEGVLDVESLRETLEEYPAGVLDVEEYEEATTSPLSGALIPKFEFMDEEDEVVLEDSIDDYEDLSDELDQLVWNDVPEPDSLPQIPLFSQLESAAFLKLLAATEHRVVRGGGVILDPDDVRLSLFVVIRGRARVEKDMLDGRTVRLSELGVGEFFGEFRLLTGNDGMARVVAETEMELLEIREEVLYELATTHPQIWDTLWSLYYTRILNNLLASSVLFERLLPSERDRLASRFVLEEFLAGEQLMAQGELCDAVFLVVSGEVWAEKRLGRGAVRRVDVLVEGDFVGVTSCATGAVSRVSVRAIADTVVLRLSATDFRACLREYDDVAQAVDYVVRERSRRSGGGEVDWRGLHVSSD